MKAIIVALIMSVTGVASADHRELAPIERSELRALHTLDQARAQVDLTRAHWDLAVANGHPVAAGKWAVRHFEALQARKAAALRVETVAAAVRMPEPGPR
jgi:hypothetical protein